MAEQLQAVDGVVKCHGTVERADTFATHACMLPPADVCPWVRPRWMKQSAIAIQSTTPAHVAKRVVAAMMWQQAGVGTAGYGTLAPHLDLRHACHFTDIWDKRSCGACDT